MKKIKKKLKKKIKYCLISLITLIILVTGYFIYNYFFVCNVDFKGKQYVSIEVNTEYVDTGVNITYRGENVKYKASNNLDTSKVGNYEYVYEYELNDKVYSKKRYISVIDTTKPEIVLNGESEVIIDFSHEYNDDGFSASDSYDGELTDPGNESQPDWC